VGSLDRKDDLIRFSSRQNQTTNTREVVAAFDNAAWEAVGRTRLIPMIVQGVIDRVVAELTEQLLPLIKDDVKAALDPVKVADAIRDRIVDAAVARLTIEKEETGT
jgi:hypothetical protein